MIACCSISNRTEDPLPGDDGLPGPERRLAVLALILGTTMAVVDTAMINVALPSIATGLEVSASRVVWVTNLYQIVCAAFLASGAPLQATLWVGALATALALLASLGRIPLAGRAQREAAARRRRRAVE